MLECAFFRNPSLEYGAQLCLIASHRPEVYQPVVSEFQFQILTFYVVKKTSKTA